MKRRVLALVTLIVAGTLATWLTAWGCAFVCGPGPLVERDYAGAVDMTMEFQGAWWARAVQREYEDPRYTIGVQDSRGRHRAYATITGVVGEVPGSEIPYRDGEWLSADAVGWPCLALVGGVSEGAESRRFGAIALPAWVSPNVGRKTLKRALPVRPIPLGFIVDTILYAAFIGLLLWGARTVRRRRRLARGLCPRCTYPIGFSERCSECGAVVPRRVPLPVD